MKKYFPEVSKTTRGRSPRPFLRPRGNIFPAGPTLTVNNVFIVYTWRDSCEKRNFVFRKGLSRSGTARRLYFSLFMIHIIYPSAYTLEL